MTKVERKARLHFNLPLRRARAHFERTYFEYHIRREGNISRVAKITGIERTHLYRKFKRLGIRR